MMLPQPKAPVTGARRSTPDAPTYSELRARNLLAQSLLSHRCDTTNPDVAAVLAALRGDLSLAGGF